MNIKKHSDRLDNLLVRCEREIHETEEKLRVLKTGRNHVNLIARESEPAAPQTEQAKVRDTGVTRSVLDVINVLWPMRKNVMTLTED